jgi:hypothetical protein
MTNISSTGGTIKQTKTGLIHYGNTEKFIVEPTDDVKDSTEFKCEWHSYFAPEVKLTGPAGRIITFKD